MSGELKMPGKGRAALLLSELNAAHAPVPPAEEETNVTTLQRYNEETGEPSTETTNAGSVVETSVREPEPAKQRPKPATPVRKKQETPVAEEGPRAAAERNTEREQRFERALATAQADDIAVVTVRVSGKLNKYLDDYVDRINRIDPKRKYRKQDAIAEAFAAFYADHVMPPAPVEDEL
jgi:hypothetical protein